eukprot:1487117-Pyramimonas_sp.AAC.1
MEASHLQLSRRWCLGRPRQVKSTTIRRPVYGNHQAKSTGMLADEKVDNCACASGAASARQQQVRARLRNAPVHCTTEHCITEATLLTPDLSVHIQVDNSSDSSDSRAFGTTFGTFFFGPRTVWT